MKRLSIRLSIIGVLIASGILAIAQAQRGDGEGSPSPLAASPIANASVGGAVTASEGNPTTLPQSPQPLLDNTALAPMGVTPGYGPDPTPQDNAAGPPRATTQMQALADVTGPPANSLAPPPLDDMGLPPTTPTGGYADLPPSGPAGASLSDLPPSDFPPSSLAGANVVQPRDLSLGGNEPSPYDLPPTDLPPTDLPPSNLPPSNLPPSNLPPNNLPPSNLPPNNLPQNNLPLPPNGLADSSAGSNFSAGAEGNLAVVTPAPITSDQPNFASDPSNGSLGGNLAPIANAPESNTAGQAVGAAPYGSPYGQAGGQSYEQPYSQPSGPSGAAADLADASSGQGNFGGPLAADPADPSDPSTAAQGDRIGAIGMVAPASAAQAAATIESAPVPGERVLEGQQTPFVAIEKRAPREIRVGQPATFEILVRNAGQVTAQDVTVIDQVPKGTQFMDATPAPQQLPNGMLVWSFGAIAPGQDRIVTLRLMPQQEGEIGSVAKVVCQAQASVRTNCTRPELAIRQTAAEQVLIGDEVEVLIEISNPGTGAVDDVVLEADIPPGLLHRKGREIDYTIGTLQPNESRTVRLQLAADQAGVVKQSIRAHAGNLEKRSSVAIEVIAPALQMTIFGPAKRYLRREAAFELELANPGTATARDIQAVVYLPQGLEFKSASHQGRYVAQNHAVFWRLEELPKGQSGKVQLTALPVAPGEQSLRAEGRGNLNTSSNTEHTLAVESLNELVFTVADVNDPIEVGSETTYEVRVTNNGSKTDANIEVVAQLPEGMQLLKADGPTEHQAEGAVISFAPLARLAPNGDAVYRLSVKGAAPGDHRLRVQIRSQESPAAVIKEEVTRVYQDR